MTITHEQQEHIYRCHNIKILDDLRVGDILFKYKHKSYGPDRHIVRVTEIELGSGDYSDFVVHFKDLEDDEDDYGDDIMRNLMYVEYNMSKVLRDLQKE